jgi:hypothetical protein
LVSFLYPVHPVDPVRKLNVYAVKFFIRSNSPFFWPAVALNTFQPAGLQAGGVTPETD